MELKLNELTPEVIDAIAATSIWRPASVKDEPQSVMTSWRVMLVEDKDIHFVGYASYEGRVCSAVQTYDPITRRGVTRSGRVYELLGPSGYNRDAMYVWSNWMRINGLTEDQVKDVSEEYDND